MPEALWQSIPWFFVLFHTKRIISDIYKYICFEVVYLDLDSNKDLFVDTQVEMGI